MENGETDEQTDFSGDRGGRLYYEKESDDCGGNGAWIAGQPTEAAGRPDPENDNDRGAEADDRAEQRVLYDAQNGQHGKCGTWHAGTGGRGDDSARRDL